MTVSEQLKKCLLANSNMRFQFSLERRQRFNLIAQSCETNLYPDMIQEAAWHISWMRVSRSRSPLSNTWVHMILYSNLGFGGGDNPARQSGPHSRGCDPWSPEWDTTHQGGIRLIWVEPYSQWWDHAGRTSLNGLARLGPYSPEWDPAYYDYP